MSGEPEKLKKCPMCGAGTHDLVPVETAMKLALTATGQGSSLPEFVCPACFDGLTGKISQGVRLRLEQESREKNKMMLWKGRVNLIRQARSLMQQKAFSEAAVTYEKYLRTLEIIYNLKAGELTPDVFNNSKRSKELTIVASVYWDLIRIYDLSPRYHERMAKAAQKLALFLPFSPIFPDIVRKAQNYLRSAKNPQVVRSLLRSVKAGGVRCFIASAAFQSPQAPEVLILRNFRERCLKPFASGRRLIWLYYRLSPHIAEVLDRSPKTRRLTAYFLHKIAMKLNKNLNS